MAPQSEHIVPPSQFNPRIPRELEDVCMKALAREREHRYGNAEEFANALGIAYALVSSKYAPRKRKS